MKGCSAFGPVFDLRVTSAVTREEDEEGMRGKRSSEAMNVDERRERERE